MWRGFDTIRIDLWDLFFFFFALCFIVVGGHFSYFGVEGGEEGCFSRFLGFFYCIYIPLSSTALPHSYLCDCLMALLRFEPNVYQLFMGGGGK